jgi:Phage holin family (Lysis protein S)
MKTFVGSSSLAMPSAVPATMHQEPAPDSRRQMMLSGPIAGTLLRFAAPTIVVVTVQAVVSVMETYFVGFLGTDALAGVADSAAAGCMAPCVPFRLHEAARRLPTKTATFLSVVIAPMF